MDNLEFLLKEQEELDKRIRDERDLHWESVGAELNDLCTAMSNEIEELRDETNNWKWWKDPEPLDKQKARQEWIDILHFLLSAGNLLFTSAEDLVDLYEAKNEINHQRQEEGY